MGCRAPQMRQPKRGLGAQPAVAVAVAVEAVRTPATPVVARSASSVRRAGVRPVVRRTSGVHTSRCPHVPVSTRPVSTRLVRSGCPDGHASGVRGLRPRCPNTRPVSTRLVRSGCPDGHASGVRGLRPRCPKCWMLECVGAVGSLRWAQQVRRAAVGPRAAWSPARAEPARTGWSWVGVEGSHEGRGPPAPRLRPALAAWPTKGAGPVPGCRSVGWGARVGPGAHQSPRGVLGKGAGVDVPPWTTQDQHQHDDHRAWSPSRSSPAPEGPSGSAGSRLRPQCGRGT
jgi:hypothetical protein